MRDRFQFQDEDFNTKKKLRQRLKIVMCRVIWVATGISRITRVMLVSKAPIVKTSDFPYPRKNRPEGVYIARSRRPIYRSKK